MIKSRVGPFLSLTRTARSEQNPEYIESRTCRCWRSSTDWVCLDVSHVETEQNNRTLPLHMWTRREKTFRINHFSFVLTNQQLLKADWNWTTVTDYDCLSHLELMICSWRLICVQSDVWCLFIFLYILNLFKLEHSLCSTFSHVLLSDVLPHSAQLSVTCDTVCWTNINEGKNLCAFTWSQY